MRFYPHPDPQIYWEIPPSWSLFCRTPNKSWKRRPLEPKHTVLYWRDLEGAKIEWIMKKHLEFENWPDTRIRLEACLPIYYSVGARFIRLEKTLVGFKCSEMPLSLVEAREVKAYWRAVAREKRRLAKLKKKAAKEAKKKAAARAALRG